MSYFPNIQMHPPQRRHIIRCRNLTIKPISINEISLDYISWLNDVETNQFLEVRHNKSTRESVIKYINEIRTKTECDFFAIFMNEDMHIGTINITNFNNNKYGIAIYGIMIGDKNAQKLGLGGLASIMLIEYLFNMPEIRKIECSAISFNVKSWKTIESLGFLREGLLREHNKLSNGNYADNYLYGIFKKEWVEKRKQFIPVLKNFTITNF